MCDGYINFLNKYKYYLRRNLLTNCLIPYNTQYRFGANLIIQLGPSSFSRILTSNQLNSLRLTVGVGTTSNQGRSL